MHQVMGNNDTEPEEEVSSWDRIIRLLEQELDWRRSKKLFVTLQGSPVHTRKRSASSCHQSAGALLLPLGSTSRSNSSSTWRSKAASISSRGGRPTPNTLGTSPRRIYRP